MKKALVLAAIAAVVFVAVLLAQDNTYVGAQKCQLCHKSEAQGRQYVIWEGTLHAKSFEALTSTKAADACKAMGVDKPAEDPRCLKCHAPLAEKAPELKAEGVSCETCHGPGSAYRKLNIMKDKDLCGQERAHPLRKPGGDQGAMHEVPRESPRHRLRFRGRLGEDQAPGPE